MTRNRRRTTTLKDVAEAAGVSSATVSSILNGSRSNTRVSPETRERVASIAKDLGYRPNAIARALVQRSTNIVGFYFGYGHLEPHDPFHAEVLTGLQNGCGETQRDLIIHYSFYRRGLDEVYRELVGGKIDGLIALAAPSDPLIRRLIDARLPVVAMTDAIQGMPSVIADDAHGSRLIANHLHEKGHRAIFYRTCPGESDSAGRRYAAFEARANELGMKVYPATTTDWKGSLGEAELDLMRRRRELGITAAVCWGDPSANALLSHCLKEGVSVPEELAIAGFNGIEPPVEPARRLTTVRASWSRVAQRAVELLVEVIEGRAVELRTVLPTEFQPGDTT